MTKKYQVVEDVSDATHIRVKTFAQLTQAQQSAAIDSAVNRLLSAICEGAIRLNDELNCDDLQARIDAALVRADEMQTPWFSGEYVMDTCADDIRGMATCDAEDALYTASGELIVIEETIGGLIKLGGYCIDDDIVGMLEAELVCELVGDCHILTFEIGVVTGADGNIQIQRLWLEQEIAKIDGVYFVGYEGAREVKEEKEV